MATKKIKKMTPAIVDQIMLWTVIFVSFVVILFLVIDYSMIMRIKGNLDLLSQYSARMIAIGTQKEDIVAQLNNIKLSYFTNIISDDITCVTSSTGTYQVIFNVNGLYDSTNILNPQNALSSKSVVFNEINSDEIECTLTLSKQ